MKIAAAAQKMKVTKEMLLKQLARMGVEKTENDEITPPEFLKLAKEIASAKKEKSSDDGKSAKPQATETPAVSSAPVDEVHAKFRQVQARQIDEEKRRIAREETERKNRERVQKLDEKKREEEAKTNAETTAHTGILPGEGSDKPRERGREVDGKSRARGRTGDPVPSQRKRPQTDKSGAQRRFQTRIRRKSRNTEQEEQEFIARQIQVPATILVSKLASLMSMRTTEVLKKLQELGVVATASQVIDQDTAILVAEEIGHEPIPANVSGPEEALMDSLVYTGEAKPRPPVVTVMGHVDHGKTSLLDKIRSTSVTEGESGGITQHIGSYKVSLPKKGSVTFLDTPGHEAFSQMRARGANLTDIVVLVVAANDGVKQQTEEAIKHALDADVPVVVAINKIDMPEVNVAKVKQELAAHNILSDEFGGTVQMIPVSAKTGEGIDELIDAILLEAEVMELAADDTGPAQGIVVEARMDNRKGPLVDVILTKGRLQKGDHLLVGKVVGRVRGLMSDAGTELKEIKPSDPAELSGLPEVPSAGDKLTFVKSTRMGQEIAAYRLSQEQAALQASQKVSLENLFDSMMEDQKAELRVLIKADVRGSLEAINTGISAFGNDKIQVKVVSSGVGGVTESDVKLASTSGAIILAFNVRPDSKAKKFIESTGVSLSLYSVIYELMEDIQKAMVGALDPVVREEITGLAFVKEVFQSAKFGMVAGCIVEEGKVEFKHPVRVLRDNVVVHQGQLDSLRRFSDSVEEVGHGNECGIGIRNYSDIRVGDRIEIYTQVTVEPTLEAVI